MKTHYSSSHSKITMTKFSIITKPPQIFKKLQFLPIFFFLLLSLAAATDIDISYSQQCDDVVRGYPPSTTPLLHFKPLVLRRAYVSGGENSPINPTTYSRKTLSFLTENAYGTENDDVFKLYGYLTINTIQIRPRNVTSRRGLRLVHFRPPRIPLVGGSYQKKFFLSGFWNSASGKLCMVGSGSSSGSASGRFGSDSHVVLKLDYLNSSDINTCLVNGTLKSLDIDDKIAYFDPISIMGLNVRFYEYKLIEKEIELNKFNHVSELVNVSWGSNLWVATDVIRSVRSVELVYKSDCDVVNCNVLGGDKGEPLPTMMYFQMIRDLGRESERENVRYLLDFGNGEYVRWRMPLDPKVMLVSEGKWDKEKKRLDMVGCRISSGEEKSENGLIGDCSVRLSLRMPLIWTLRERNALVGELWSSKGINESGYFGSVELRSSSNSYARGEGLKYEYREIENVKKHCKNQKIREGKEGGYPSALSSDMRFDMVVTDNKGKKGWGYSSPLTVGDRFYQQMRYAEWPDLRGDLVKHNDTSKVNISYVLSFQSFGDVKLTEISAEGLYDSNNGHLCMVGCKHVALPNMKAGNNNVIMDCDILINVQYASLNAKRGASTKGTIQSTRNNSDPLYFDPLEISSHSIYQSQARDSIWRMDIEITMVLISNTLTCVFVGLQLFYVKRNPNVLPSVSVMMVVVLTLAHMIPLLLNFEAMFLANRNRQNFYLGNDGWLEVNEVLVRVITMIAFLLEFRLLQLTWSARSEDSNNKSLWVSDKKTLYLSLPLYISGGLITWLFHLSRKSRQNPYLGLRYSGHQKQSLWGGLKSYAGLILDGFLLPQILFNTFYDSSENALAPSFYVGTTLVRLLPHAYDLYRAHSSTWSFSYIYANPRMDYFSTAWDIIISIGGLLFVLLIFLQQRFGGRCFLPKRFRQSSVYEKVPAISSEQL